MRRLLLIKANPAEDIVETTIFHDETFATGIQRTDKKGRGFPASFYSSSPFVRMTRWNQ